MDAGRRRSMTLAMGSRRSKGEMWFSVTDQPVFAAAGFWQPIKEGKGFTMVTCQPNALVAPIQPKAMITVLEPRDIYTWLCGSYDDAVALQRPYDTQTMTVHDAQTMTVREPVFPTRRKEN